MPTVPAGPGLALVVSQPAPRAGARYSPARRTRVVCRDPGPAGAAEDDASAYYDRPAPAAEYQALPLRSPAARRRAQDVERALGALGVMAGVLNRSLGEGPPEEGGLPLSGHAQGALLDGMELLARGALGEFHRLVRALGEGGEAAGEARPKGGSGGRQAG